MARIVYNFWQLSALWKVSLHYRFKNVNLHQNAAMSRHALCTHFCGRIAATDVAVRFGAVISIAQIAAGRIYIDAR